MLRRLPQHVVLEFDHMGQEHAPPLSYLERTKATKRAQNRIAAIENLLRSVQNEQARVDRGGAGVGGTASPSGKRAVPVEALEEERARLRRSVNDRKMSKVKATVRRAKQPRTTGGEARPQGDGERPVDGGPASRAAGPMVPDWTLYLWGKPRPQAGSRPLPAFDDPMLARAADMFRIPGLAHFMVGQIERQAVFDGFDEVLSRRDPAFDRLALADAICDCEIDMEVAHQLMHGETELASALLALVAADTGRA